MNIQDIQDNFQYNFFYYELIKNSVLSGQLDISDISKIMAILLKAPKKYTNLSLEKMIYFLIENGYNITESEINDIFLYRNLVYVVRNLLEPPSRGHGLQLQPLNINLFKFSDISSIKMYGLLKKHGIIEPPDFLLTYPTDQGTFNMPEFLEYLDYMLFKYQDDIELLGDSLINYLINKGHPNTTNDIENKYFMRILKMYHKYNADLSHSEIEIIPLIELHGLSYTKFIVEKFNIDIDYDYYSDNRKIMKYLDRKYALQSLKKYNITMKQRKDLRKAYIQKIAESDPESEYEIFDEIFSYNEIQKIIKIARIVRMYDV